MYCLTRSAPFTCCVMCVRYARLLYLYEHVTFGEILLLPPPVVCWYWDRTLALPYTCWELPVTCAPRTCWNTVQSKASYQALQYKASHKKNPAEVVTFCYTAAGNHSC
jgi:hypothetical protein